MTNEQLRQIFLFLQQQAANNPYFIFIYNWGIVDLSGGVVTAAEAIRCLDATKFPPIGKNQMICYWLTETEKKVANLWGKEFLKQKGLLNVDKMSPEQVVVQMIKLRGLDSQKRQYIMCNNGVVKKNLMEQITEAVSIVLDAGFGRIEVIIDEEKGIYDVIPSPRIRVKS